MIVSGTGVYKAMVKPGSGPTGSLGVVYSPITIPTTLFKCRKMAAMTMDPLWVVGFFNLPVFFEAVDDRYRWIADGVLRCDRS